MLHIYKASAGSGKTYTLTLEYIKLLLGYRDEQGRYQLYRKSDAQHRRILAVTFTNKATEEMKHRIVFQLDILAHDTEKSPYVDGLMQLFGCTVEQIRGIASETLYVLLHDFSYFNISTIDRFFQQVLRNFTREIGLQGSFEIEMDNDFVTASAIDRMYSELSDIDQKGLLNWLIHYAEERIESGNWWSLGNRSERKDDLRELAGELSKETYKLFRNEILSQIKDKSVLDDYLKEMRRIRVEFESLLRKLGEAAMAVLERYGLSPDDFKGKGRSWIQYLKKIVDGKVEPPTQTFRANVGNRDGWFLKKEIPACIDSLYEKLNPVLQEMVDCFGEPYVRYNTAVQSSKYIYALGILVDIDRRIEEYEKEHNVLLLSDTAGILNAVINENDAPFIYEKIGTRVNHFMIDEFQDTSKLQWQNFAPLIGESLSHDHTDLIVGDVKQSIYRWRNSDWSLLNEGVQSLFRPSQYSERSMNMNYRSCACIVEFNNRIFGEAARLLQQKLEREIEESALVEGSFDVKIEKAYADIGQRVADSNLLRSGHVSVTMWESDKKEDFYNESLARIPDLLRDLQDRGYTPGDITFLTRTAREGTMLVDLLLRLNSENTDGRYRYDVISSESLLIRNSPIINLLIGILRYIQDPSIELNRLLAVYEYNSRKFKASDDAVILSYFEDRENIGRHLDNDFFSFVESIRKEPLFEMCERIISYFSDEGADEGERVYIQAFQDYVLDYCRTHTADLGSFLSWWDDNEDKLSVTTPQEQDAMRVMTIHKSKGLEFKAVIIPFCNWSLDHQSNQTNFVWCHTHEEPFSRIPVLPLRYGNSLAQTYYATEYFDEKMYACIDNLNIAYVAFTRAEEELHILAPAVKNKSDKGRFGSISAVLGEVLFPEGNDGGDLHYEVGIDWRAEKKKKNVSAVPSFPAGIYRSIEPGNRLHLRLQGKGVFGEGKDRTYGTLMHRILSQIETLDRIDDTIAAFVRSGELSESESKSIREDINRWLADERVSSWFSPGVNVWTEREILQPDGSFYRPDRVVETNNEVIVVDYKFGNVERASYKRQVSTYTSLIEKMGYDRVSGFIWYVSLGKLERV